jgi:hypothetical protein
MLYPSELTCACCADRNRYAPQGTHRSCSVPAGIADPGPLQLLAITNTSVRRAPREERAKAFVSIPGLQMQRPRPAKPIGALVRHCRRVASGQPFETQKGQLIVNANASIAWTRPNGPGRRREMLASWKNCVFIGARTLLAKMVMSMPFLIDRHQREIDSSDLLHAAAE